MISSQAKKNIYAVIGVPRSGTSVMARGMQALGIDLGDKLEVPNALWNPKGFFEDLDIVFKINRAVLLALNYTWLSVNLVDQLCQNNAMVNGLKNFATDLLQQKMGTSNYWGFKDPRTAQILPFWQEIFQRLQVKDHYIIALRNPLSSAYSYQRVSGVDIEVGLLLWVMHLIPAISGTHKKKRIVVSYEALLKNPRQQLDRIKNYFALPILNDDKAIEEYANEFLDKDLYHFEHTETALMAHPAYSVAKICGKMYTLFLQLANDEIDFASNKFTALWQEIENEFKQSYPTYCYLDVLLKRNKKFERQLRTIHRSLPWKLIYPLRLVDDKLRLLRRQKRIKKRLVTSYD